VPFSTLVEKRMTVINKRKLNVVVSGLSENSTDGGDKDTFSALGSGALGISPTIVKCGRFVPSKQGPHSDDIPATTLKPLDSTKPRLLFVTLSSVEEENEKKTEIPVPVQNSLRKK